MYQLEKTVNQAASAFHDAENAPLLEGEDNPDVVFRRALDADLEKICSFYRSKEQEILSELRDVKREEESYEAEADTMEDSQISTTGDKTMRPRRGSLFNKFGFGNRPRRSSNLSASTIDEADEDGDSDEETALDGRSSLSGAPMGRRKTYDASAAQAMEEMRSSRELPPRKRRASQAYDDYSDHAFSTMLASGITLKKRIISLYVSLCELKSFIQLNKTGFTKVLKKYDKILNRNLKNIYLKERVAPAYPFKPATLQQIDDHIQNTEKAYADLVTKGDLSQGRRELRLHLREHVVWERNTVWREMIGIERKAQAANLGVRRTLLGDNDAADARRQGDDDQDGAHKELGSPAGKYRIPRWLLSSTFITLVVIVACFIVLLVLPTVEKREQRNCLAMLVFVSLLWATEVCGTLILRSLLIVLGYTTIRHGTPRALFGCGASGR